jgi:hypothetical protein
MGKSPQRLTLDVGVAPKKLVTRGMWWRYGHNSRELVHAGIARAVQDLPDGRYAVRDIVVNWGTGRPVLVHDYVERIRETVLSALADALGGIVLSVPPVTETYDWQSDGRLSVVVERSVRGDRGEWVWGDEADPSPLYRELAARRGE